MKHTVKRGNIMLPIKLIKFLSDTRSTSVKIMVYIYVVLYHVSHSY